MKNKPIIHSNDVSWTDNQAPYSRRFGDIYFMPEAGLEESRHVFLSANQLGHRWHQLSSNETFTVFECGFGTGLNFLATIELWLSTATSGHLNYVAFEGFPLTVTDLTKALIPFATQLPLMNVLINNYDKALSGERVQVTEQISLTLLLYQADDLIINKDDLMPINAVYLDGFSPAKNPEMWSIELCQWLYNHCANGASLSTFTVAGVVKRNLESAGFQINKIPGFGKKRSMLTAQKVAS